MAVIGQWRTLGHAMKDQQRHAKAFMDAIREVLVRDWDPIDLMSDPSAPRDEYDAYIGPLASALARGDTASTIAEQLSKIEQQEMGLGVVPSSSRLEVANKLKGISIRASA